MLASQGMQGPAEALEGKNGWFHAVTDQIDENCLKGTDHFLIHDCYFKLYPSCRHTHCGIDAAVALHSLVKASDISAVNVYIYPNAIKLAGIQWPQNAAETKFSIQYTMACALYKGSYGLEDMNPLCTAEDVSELVRKIRLLPDEAMENKNKGIRGARVEVIKNDGSRIEKTVLIPKGDPENPVTREDIIEKLKTCAKDQASEETLCMLIDSVYKIEGKNSFSSPIAIVK